MNPNDSNYEITEQDMLFLRALAGRRKIQVGINPSAAQTAACEASIKQLEPIATFSIRPRGFLSLWLRYGERGKLWACAETIR